MQVIEMTNLNQFAAWKKIADEDIEFASDVLKWIHEIQYPSTPEECLEALISEEDAEFQGYGVAHPVYGMPEDAARKISEMTQ